MCFISKNGSYFCVYPAVKAHTESRPACFACPSTVYCRGHHLPSVRVRISASTHQPPRPSALFTHQPPNESLAECHITQQRVCVRVATPCSFSTAAQKTFIAVRL